MGLHIQKSEGKIHLCMSSVPFLQGHHDISKYIFSEPTSLQSQKYLLSRLLLITLNEDLMKMLRRAHWLQYLEDRLAWCRAACPRNNEHSLAGSGCASEHLFIESLWLWRWGHLYLSGILPSLYSRVQEWLNVGVCQENKRTQRGPQEARNPAKSPPWLS